MKSHSVKSNAKRAARQIAAAAPEKWEVADPVRSGNGGWFPALRAKVPGLSHDLAVIVGAESDAVVTSTVTVKDGAVTGITITNPGLGFYDQSGNPKFVLGAPALVSLADLVDEFSGVAGIVGVEPGDLAPAPVCVVVKTGNVGKSEPGAVAVVDGVQVLHPKGYPVDASAIRAALDAPRPCSTREEIDARRAARRDRLAAEPSTRRPVGRPDQKTKKILELIAAPDGITLHALADALGWQRHTVRGYVATLNKRAEAAGKKRVVASVKHGKTVRYVAG